MRQKGEANQRWRESGEATICSETHLSWIVSVSAVGRGDVEAVRVCECLYGVFRTRNNSDRKEQHNQRSKKRKKEKKERKRNDTKKKHRCHNKEADWTE